eukprot:GILI01008323.1.p1 GENE.GILI01008323.1~~GILI01008323.1.p1  ORF type:complete len:226 (+),score=50.22 GILI01008323.1:53-730(+)
MLRRVAFSVPHTTSTPLAASAATSGLLVARRCFASKNPYTTLGIKNGASKTDIKKAYRVLAAKHHPDAPGGSNEKFQEIQAAYEEVKSGVWIPKDGGDGGGDGVSRNNNKYGGFQWYTDGKRKNKVSYDKMQQKMQGADEKDGPSFDDDDEEEVKSKFKNPMGASDHQVEAWFRFISSWAIIFVTFRVSLFLLFPPKHQHNPKKPLPDRPRRPPPPKALPTTPAV